MSVMFKVMSPQYLKLSRYNLKSLSSSVFMIPLFNEHLYVLLKFYKFCFRSPTKICLTSLPFPWFQVIKAFKIPDFFIMVFPFLFETCNSNALILSAQLPMASDAVKAGNYTI